MKGADRNEMRISRYKKNQLECWKSKLWSPKNIVNRVNCRLDTTNLWVRKHYLRIATNTVHGNKD